MNSNWKLLPASLLVAVLALAGCGGGSGEPTGPTDEERAAMMEMQEAAEAIQAANAAAMALSNDSDDSAVTAAEGLIATAKDEIGDLPEADQAAQLAMLSGAESTVMAHRGRLTAEAEAEAAKTEEERIKAEQEAERMRQEAEEARKAAEAMAAMAAKLYAGIGASPLGLEGRATYTGDNFQIDLTADDVAGTADPDAAVEGTALESAMITALGDWSGAELTSSDGTYTARVYSNSAPTEGAKFNVQYPETAAFVNSGVVTIDTTGTDTPASRVSSSSFDQSAGTKTFELAENREYLEFAGSFHGVPGTYTCTPADVSADRDTCGATVATMGFTLIGGAWTFKPDDAEQKVSSAPDVNYASFGWWLYEDGDDVLVSAFDGYHGTDPGTVAIGNLRGTATYEGEAAGKYALHSTTGGTNDAGHFTADATLEATFGEEHRITGTIDNFMGADGMMRDWSVKLNTAGVVDGGGITGSATGVAVDDNNPNVGTVWTIGGTAADASGAWSGDLREQGSNGVPATATGTFSSQYGNSGRMVGGFGATTE